MRRLHNVIDRLFDVGLMPLLTLCALCLPGGANLAAELDGEKLNQIAQEIVVTIEDSDGVSGGVVISSNGLILCDDRAVVTLGPRTFTVRSVNAQGEVTETEYTDYKLVGVHKEHHLALVQLVGVKQRLKAARWRKPRGKDDLDAYLFGYTVSEPDGEMKGPIKAQLYEFREELKDAVSRVKSDVDDVYGDMPCALALSPRGQVLGVIYHTRKRNGGSYISLGVLLELERRLFGDPKRREVRKDGHAEVKKIGDEYRISWKRGRTLLADDWQSAKACAEIGRSLVHYKRYEDARRYLDFALEKDPYEGTALHGLEQLLKDHEQPIYDEGSIEEQLFRLREEVFRLWAQKPDVALSTDIMKLTKYLSERGQTDKAVYYQAWHIAVDPDGRLRQINSRFLAAVSDEQREHLTKLKHARQYSVRDLEAFLGKTDQGVVAEGQPDFEKLHAQAKPFPSEGVMIDVGEGVRISAIEMGHFGHYAAILTSKRLGGNIDADHEYKITLYDMIDGSKVRDLRTVIDKKTPRFSIGANLVILYLQTPSVYEVIDIHTAEKIVVKPSPFSDARFTRISPERDDVVLVPGKGKIFLPEFRYVDFVEGGESVEYVKYLRHRVLHDSKYGSQSSFYFPPPGPERPKPKGQRQYLIYNSADAFVQLSGSGKLEVLRIEDHGLIKGDLLPDWADVRNLGLKAISGNADRMIIRHRLKPNQALLLSLGLRAHAKQAGAFGNAPGETWRMKLAVDPKAEVEVQDGPDGMRYDAATQSLIWSIPKDQTPGKISLIVLVREPGKDERYLLPEFTVEKAK